MLTRHDLPPGYDLFADPDRCIAILSYNGTPLPVLFMSGDYPVTALADQAAIAFAIQAENHSWRFSRNNPEQWPACCNQAVAWQRLAMRNLEEIAKINPVMRANVTDMMLMAALRGRLPEYREAFDKLLPHSTDVRQIEDALAEAMFGQDRAASRAKLPGTWPDNFQPAVTRAIQTIDAATDAQARREFMPSAAPNPTLGVGDWLTRGTTAAAAMPGLRLFAGPGTPKHPTVIGGR